MSESSVKRRWLPHLRFSLRTLLFLVLLIASGATLWWNWGPWAPAFSIHEDHPITKMGAEGGKGQFIYDVYDEKKPPGTSRIVIDERAAVDRQLAHVVRTREFLTGREPAAELIESWGKKGYIFHHLSDTGKYAYFSKGNRTLLCGTDCTESFELEDPGFEIDEVAFFANDTVLSLRSLDAISLRVLPTNEHALYRLPERKYWFKGRYATASPDWIVTLKERTLCAYKSGGSIPVYTWGNCDGIPELRGDTLCVRSRNISSIRFYDLKSGALITQFDGITHCVLDDQFKFALLFKANSLMSLWQIQPTLKEIRSFTKTSGIYEIHGDRLYGTFPMSVENLFTGEKIWSRPDRSTPFKCGGYSPDFHFAIWEGDAGVQTILDARAGQTLFEFSRLRWPKEFPMNWVEFDWSGESSAFVTAPLNSERDMTSRTETITPADHYTVWKLKRPLEWYGIAWLPEFWLTFGLSSALLWSLWRDRRLA